MSREIIVASGVKLMPEIISVFSTRLQVPEAINRVAGTTEPQRPS
jgi:hypothetical protein